MTYRVLSRIAYLLTLALVVGSWLLPAGGAWASSVDIAAFKDATLFQNNPNNSAGGQTQFFVGTNSAASPRRGLAAFDIAGNVPSLRQHRPAAGRDLYPGRIDADAEHGRR